MRGVGGVDDRHHAVQVAARARRASADYEVVVAALFPEIDRVLAQRREVRPPPVTRVARRVVREV